MTTSPVWVVGCPGTDPPDTGNVETRGATEQVPVGTPLEGERVRCPVETTHNGLEV